MNKERILALADRIEAAPVEPTPDKMSFSLSSWGSIELDENDNACGTVGCVAGWAACAYAPDVWKAYLDPDKPRELDLFDTGKDALGLPPRVAQELFIPTTVVWASVTPAVAAKALRILAETGKVDYVAAGGEERIGYF